MKEAIGENSCTLDSVSYNCSSDTFIVRAYLNGQVGSLYGTANCVVTDTGYFGCS
ncbi:MAG: hypothetical protein Q4P14_05760 [Methanobacteriaceae archaeon]|nr:hypothetical protein [Methanobacteriaceae archaeon]